MPLIRRFLKSLPSDVLLWIGAKSGCLKAAGFLLLNSDKLPIEDGLELLTRGRQFSDRMIIELSKALEGGKETFMTFATSNNLDAKLVTIVTASMAAATAAAVAYLLHNVCKRRSDVARRIVRLLASRSVVVAPLGPPGIPNLGVLRLTDPASHLPSRYEVNYAYDTEMPNSIRDAYVAVAGIAPPFVGIVYPPQYTRLREILMVTDTVTAEVMFYHTFIVDNLRAYAINHKRDEILRQRLTERAMSMFRENFDDVHVMNTCLAGSVAMAYFIWHDELVANDLVQQRTIAEDLSIVNKQISEEIPTLMERISINSSLVTGFNAWYDSSDMRSD